MPMRVFSILLIISILGVFIFTEIILDCSMITDLHMIFFILNISFVIHAMILYIKKVNNFLSVMYNIYMILFVFCLWINRVRVNKFVLMDENYAKIFITNEVNVFFIISPLNIKDSQMKIDFDDFIYHINRQIKNRIKNEELNIFYDFTKYKICKHEEILKFNRFIDHIHFSKFGRQINYFLKLPLVKISNIKNLNLSLQCRKNNFNIPKSNTLEKNKSSIEKNKFNYDKNEVKSQKTIGEEYSLVSKPPPPPPPFPPSPISLDKSKIIIIKKSNSVVKNLDKDKSKVFIDELTEKLKHRREKQNK